MSPPPGCSDPTVPAVNSSYGSVMAKCTVQCVYVYVGFVFPSRFNALHGDKQTEATWKFPRWAFVVCALRTYVYVPVFACVYVNLSGPRVKATISKVQSGIKYHSPALVWSYLELTTIGGKTLYDH